MYNDVEIAHLTTLGDFEMTNKISDLEFIKLLVGGREIRIEGDMNETIDFRVRRRSLEWDSCGRIAKSDFEVIKNIFPGILRTLPITKQLLLILWIREIKFATDPLSDDEMYDYIPGVFAFNRIKISNKRVLKELNVLIDNECLVEDDEEEFDYEYPITAKGEFVAEETFKLLKTLISPDIESSPTISEIENVVESTDKLIKKRDVKGRSERIKNAAYDYYPKLLKGEDVTKESIAIKHRFTKEKNVLSKEHVQRKFGLDKIEDEIDNARRCFGSITNIDDKEIARLLTLIYNVLKR